VLNAFPGRKHYTSSEKSRLARTNIMMSLSHSTHCVCSIGLLRISIITCNLGGRICALCAQGRVCASTKQTHKLHFFLSPARQHPRCLLKTQCTSHHGGACVHLQQIFLRTAGLDYRESERERAGYILIALLLLLAAATLISCRAACVLYNTRKPLLCVCFA
jgi:hypothetical protein